MTRRSRTRSPVRIPAPCRLASATPALIMTYRRSGSRCLYTLGTKRPGFLSRSARQPVERRQVVPSCTSEASIR
jgi:hypothetical protein